MRPAGAALLKFPAARDEIAVHRQPFGADDDVSAGDRRRLLDVPLRESRCPTVWRPTATFLNGELPADSFAAAYRAAGCGRHHKLLTAGDAIASEQIKNVGIGIVIPYPQPAMPPISDK